MALENAEGTTKQAERKERKTLNRVAGNPKLEEAVRLEAANLAMYLEDEGPRNSKTH